MRLFMSVTYVNLLTLYDSSNVSKKIMTDICFIMARRHAISESTICRLTNVKKCKNYRKLCRIKLRPERQTVCNSQIKANARRIKLMNEEYSSYESKRLFRSSRCTSGAYIQVDQCSCALGNVTLHCLMYTSEFKPRGLKPISEKPCE